MADRKGTTLWQKGVEAEDWVTRFTVGEDYRWDTLLLPYDVEGTRAHAWGLVQIDVLTAGEYERIQATLDALLQAYGTGTVQVLPEDEDCHTVIERYLTEALGDIGKKIHTGRSRNDQVLTALRLYLRENLDAVGEKVAQLAEDLCQLGETYDQALMPGYTHFQRAMPTSAGQWALGYAELLAGDLQTLAEARDHINVSPLGSAAGYGVPHLKLPRKEVAERLGFRDLQVHVTAVQLSRGKFELQIVHALVQVAATVNRMASDLILFNTSEYGFVQLPAAYCTGSSIMPQKKNPDVLELARANYHRLLAEMQVLLTLPANLPSGYHRDLQLTKQAVMESMRLSHDLLTAMLQLVPGIQFDRERMRALCTPELFATAVALENVLTGMPFREAYRKAADQKGAWGQEDLDHALRAYSVDGYPGKGRPDLIRKALEKGRAERSG